MKDYDLMSYHELKAAMCSLEGKLACLKRNDVKTKRTLEQEKHLVYQTKIIQGLLILAKHDDKVCKDVGKDIIEKILKDNGVFTKRLLEDISSRVTARHVDISYEGKGTFYLRDVKTRHSFKAWIKYKLQTIANQL